MADYDSLICQSCGSTPDERHTNDCTAQPYVNPYVRKIKTATVTKETYPQSGINMNNEIVLDPGDPFESALIQMVKTNRAKRRDYAIDSDRAGGGVFSNFEETSLGIRIEGFGSTEAALFNVLQKLARIRSLRANERLDDPENESVLDTYLDLAVYAVITYAIAKQKLEK